MPRSKVVEGSKVIHLDKSQVVELAKVVAKSGLLGSILKGSVGIKQPRKTLVKAGKPKAEKKPKAAEKKEKKKKKSDSDSDTDSETVSVLRRKLKALSARKDARSKKPSEDRAVEDSADAEGEAPKVQRSRPGTRMRQLRHKLLSRLSDSAAHVPRIIPQKVMRRLIEAMYPSMLLSNDAVALVCSNVLTLIPRIQRAVALTRKCAPNVGDDPKAKTPPVRAALLEQCLWRG